MLKLILSLVSFVLTVPAFSGSTILDKANWSTFELEGELLCEESNSSQGYFKAFQIFTVGDESTKYRMAFHGISFYSCNDASDAARRLMHEYKILFSDIKIGNIFKGSYIEGFGFAPVKEKICSEKILVVKFPESETDKETINATEAKVEVRRVRCPCDCSHSE